MSNAPFTFTFERDDYDGDKEHLSIVSVEGDSDRDRDIAANDFALTIQSLNDPDCYWLDSGAFNINIKANS